MMPHSHSRVIWPLIAGMALLTAASFALAGLRLDFASNPYFFIAIALLFAISWFYASVRPNARLHLMTATAGQILLILLFGILLTYAAMATDFPYRDADLYMIDQTLGLSRHAYLDFFHSRPWLLSTMTVAYFSFLPQFAVVPMLLLLIGGQVERLHAMMLAIGIALILTSAISIFIPAVDAFVYVDITPRVFAKISGQIFTQVPTLEALRSGALHNIRLDNLEGLITFPSFHTAGALMFAWALVRTSYVRWVGLALNAMLIAATPVIGAHYFIDVAGGATVAAASIFAAHRLHRAASRWSWLRPAAAPSAALG